MRKEKLEELVKTLWKQLLASDIIAKCNLEQEMDILQKVKKNKQLFIDNYTPTDEEFNVCQFLLTKNLTRSGSSFKKYETILIVNTNFNETFAVDVNKQTCVNLYEII